MCLLSASLSCASPGMAPGSPSGGSAASSRGAKLVWPQGKKAAITLTYDDALSSQLAIARPALAQHRLHATFFVTEGAKKDPASWRALSERDGHELGSHTLLHPCQRSYDWVPKGNALEDYDQARMKAELEESVKMLDSLGARRPYTFAYPCGSTWIGKDHESYVPLVKGLFFAARGVSGDIADPATESLESTPAISGNKTGEELIALVKQAEERQGWLVLLFHGVGGDYLTVQADAHEQLLAYLDKRRDELWVDTFGAVSAHVQSHRHAP